MQRDLNNKIQWDDELIKIENLDWENNESDFNLLVNFVLKRIESHLTKEGEKIEDYLSTQHFREAVKIAAREYKKKHVSLGMFVYWRIKFHYFRKKQETGQS